ncbi:MAG: D-glycero-beta-D-manno-heptose 1,7-bisphosphate 7-phosphatase [Planctomycetes bacterium]|nr:D-glycero-beta-D-manno-heptose 1,7-bisphosphate 7-phosphatase [Planctomycetota bacterium]MCB9904125.1 D-glycero-beta-D-manno-heptose 1,7-bisphosphate 7-phosphatase [Planctomycetota bacterium]
MSTAARPAVFLDRDGTINVERDYLDDPSEVELIPGAAEAIRELNVAGFPVVVVTNQSGIARGMFDESRLAEITRRLDELLAARGAKILASYYCPHHPDYGGERYQRVCDCRKPGSGMLEQAAREHGLDLSASWIIGDSLRDLEAGAAVGAHGILVATGKGAEQYAAARARGEAPEDFAADLGAAVRLVLGRT